MKKIGTRRLISALLASVMVLGSVNVPGLLTYAANTTDFSENRLVYLDFNELQDDNSLSGGSGVKVTSGNASNVTATGHVLAEETFAGYAGKSLYLDGTGANYLSLSKEDETGVLAEKDAFTISYWSKVTNSGHDKANWSFMVMPETNGTWERQYIGMLETNLISDTVTETKVILERGEASTDESGNVTYSSPSKAHTCEDSEWKLITAVFEDKAATFYVDGEKAGTATYNTSITDILGDAKKFYIGSSAGVWDEYFTGYIDEFQVWDYAMDEEKVTALQTSPSHCGEV